jgi:hypothetical protein
MPRGPSLGLGEDGKRRGSNVTFAGVRFGRSPVFRRIPRGPSLGFVKDGQRTGLVSTRRNLVALGAGGVGGTNVG